MCGISGISSSKLSTTLLTREFLDMCYLSFVAHRGSHSNGVAWRTAIGIKSVVDLGPPGQKVYLAAASHPPITSVIGHVRLASQGAITLANAHPIYNEDNSMVIIHNGHLHNSHKLETQLKHHSFRSQTDSELILHLFEDTLKDFPPTTAGYAKALSAAINQCAGQRNVIIMLQNGTQIAHADSALCIEKSNDVIRIASVPTTRSNRWARLLPGTILVIRNGEILEKLDSAPTILYDPPKPPTTNLAPTQFKIAPDTIYNPKKKIDWGFWK